MELEEFGYLPKPKGLVIKEKISIGSYCTVQRGTLDGKPVAVKRLYKFIFEAGSQEPSSMYDIKSCFIRAGSILSSDHPGIVNIIGAYYDKQTGEPLLVMELMKENLRQYLAEIKGRLSVAEQCSMCRDITSALVYLHQQDPPIAYCALTSRNILISFNGQVKLGACSGAQRKPPGGYFDIMMGGIIMCVPCVPEALSHDDCYDEKIDVYSLGVVMTEIVTQHPSSAKLMSELSEIPEDHPLKPIILQCLQDNPVDRPNSASILKEIKKICPVSQRKYLSTHLLIHILSI